MDGGSLSSIAAVALLIPNVSTTKQLSVVIQHSQTSSQETGGLKIAHGGLEFRYLDKDFWLTILKAYTV